MDCIHAVCRVDGKLIACAMSRYVRRDRIRDDFWCIMGEEPCQALRSIAFGIFDRYGFLRRDLIQHEVRKGTGVWGEELDYGSLFTMEHMLIGRAWRRKGLGTLMLKSLHAKVQTGSRRAAFALVIPSWNGRDIEKEVEGKSEREQRAIRYLARDKATAFYRSFGFRRVGASDVFALAFDPDHKAHALPAQDDFEQQLPFEDDDNSDEDEGLGFLSDEDESPATKRLAR